MRVKAALFAGAAIALFHAGTAGAQAVPEYDVVIGNVTVIDVETGEALPSRTVRIQDGRIASVDLERADPASGAEFVDGTGAFLIPGLIDVHIHTDASGLPLFLEHGITTVRDMGTHFAPLEPGSGGQLAMRDQVRADPLAGPEMILALRILDGDIERNPRWAMHYASVRNPAEGRDMARQAAVAGADVIKVYSDLSAETFCAIAEETAATGLPMVGHVPFSVGYAEAARAGLLTAEHLSGLFIDLSRDEQRWRAAAVAAAASRDPSASYDFVNSNLLEIAGSIDPAKEAALFALLAEEGTGLVPTLVVLDNPRWRYPSTAPDPALVGRLSPIYRSIVSGSSEAAAAGAGAGIAAFDLQSALVGRAHRAGVDILVGTDAANPSVVPGISLHEELANLVRAGLSPAEALRAATLVNARYLGLQDRLGSIAPGKEADLVLLQGNPLEDIAASRSIVRVMADGLWLPLKEEPAGGG